MLGIKLVLFGLLFFSCLQQIATTDGGAWFLPDTQRATKEEITEWLGRPERKKLSEKEYKKLDAFLWAIYRPKECTRENFIRDSGELDLAKKALDKFVIYKKEFEIMQNIFGSTCYSDFSREFKGAQYKEHPAVKKLTDFAGLFFTMFEPDKKIQYLIRVAKQEHLENLFNIDNWYAALHYNYQNYGGGSIFERDENGQERLTKERLIKLIEERFIEPCRADIGVNFNLMMDKTLQLAKSLPLSYEMYGSAADDDLAAVAAAYGICLDLKNDKLGLAARIAGGLLERFNEKIQEKNN